MRAIVTVVGKDRVGIIAEVCSMLAAQDVNILDISQTVLQDYFTMMMLVDATGCKISFIDLAKLLSEKGAAVGLEIRAQREDLFLAMHRI